MGIFTKLDMCLKNVCLFMFDLDMEFRDMFETNSYQMFVILHHIIDICLKTTCFTNC